MIRFKRSLFIWWLLGWLAIPTTNAASLRQKWDKNDLLHHPSHGEYTYAPPTATTDFSEEPGPINPASNNLENAPQMQLPKKLKNNSVHEMNSRFNLKKNQFKFESRQYSTLVSPEDIFRKQHESDSVSKKFIANKSFEFSTENSKHRKKNSSKSRRRHITRKKRVPQSVLHGKPTNIKISTAQTTLTEASEYVDIASNSDIYSPNAAQMFRNSKKINLEREQQLKANRDGLSANNYQNKLLYLQDSDIPIIRAAAATVENTPRKSLRRIREILNIPPSVIKGKTEKFEGYQLKNRERTFNVQYDLDPSSSDLKPVASIKNQPTQSPKPSNLNTRNSELIKEDWKMYNLQRSGLNKYTTSAFPHRKYHQTRKDMLMGMDKTDAEIKASKPENKRQWMDWEKIKPRPNMFEENVDLSQNYIYSFPKYRSTFQNANDFQQKQKQMIKPISNEVYLPEQSHPTESRMYNFDTSDYTGEDVFIKLSDLKGLKPDNVYATENNVQDLHPTANLYILSKQDFRTAAKRPTVYTDQKNKLHQNADKLFFTENKTSPDTKPTKFITQIETTQYENNDIADKYEEHISPYPRRLKDVNKNKLQEKIHLSAENNINDGLNNLQQHLPIASYYADAPLFNNVISSDKKEITSTFVNEDVANVIEKLLTFFGSVNASEESTFEVKPEFNITKNITKIKTSNGKTRNLSLNIQEEINFPSETTNYYGNSKIFNHIKKFLPMVSSVVLETSQNKMQTDNLNSGRNQARMEEPEAGVENSVLNKMSHEFQNNLNLMKPYTESTPKPSENLYPPSNYHTVMNKMTENVFKFPEISEDDDLQDLTIGTKEMETDSFMGLQDEKFQEEYRNMLRNQFVKSYFKDNESDGVTEHLADELEDSVLNELYNVFQESLSGIKTHTETPTIPPVDLTAPKPYPIPMNEVNDKSYEIPDTSNNLHDLLMRLKEIKPESLMNFLEVKAENISLPPHKIIKISLKKDINIIPDSHI